MLIFAVSSSVHSTNLVRMRLELPSCTAETLLQTVFGGVLDAGVLSGIKESGGLIEWR